MTDHERKLARVAEALGQIAQEALSHRRVDAVTRQRIRQTAREALIYIGVAEPSAAELAANSQMPVKRVQHAKLERTDESLFRSRCPFCGEGVLLMRRDPDTMRLIPLDICVRCGRKVRYIDLARTGLT